MAIEPIALTLLALAVLVCVVELWGRVASWAHRTSNAKRVRRVNRD